LSSRRCDAILPNKSAADTLGKWEVAMLVTMQNADLIDKLVTLANGNIELVQQAIRETAGPQGAELRQVVEYIVAHRTRTRVPEVA
jgi:hypothetical protein